MKIKSNEVARKAKRLELPGGFFNRSSYMEKPFTRYSLNRAVAHWRNLVPRGLRTWYPTAGEWRSYAGARHLPAGFAPAQGNLGFPHRLKDAVRHVRDPEEETNTLILSSSSRQGTGPRSRSPSSAGTPAPSGT